MTWTFARRPKWVAGHLLVGCAAGAMIGLALWQLDRLDARRQVNARIASAAAAEPVDAQVLSIDNAPAYRRVAETGRWLGGHTVYVRYPILDGRPGYYVMTPLRPDSGPAVLVLRGWIPLEEGKDDALPVETTDDEVSVTGFVSPGGDVGSGPPGRTQGSPGVPTVASLDVDVLRTAARLDDASPFVLQLQSPVQPGLKALPPPEITEGSHLAYALQWLAFSVIVVAGWGVLLVRTARDPGDQ